MSEQKWVDRLLREADHPELLRHTERSELVLTDTMTRGLCYAACAPWQSWSMVVRDSTPSPSQPRSLTSVLAEYTKYRGQSTCCAPE